MSWPRRGGRALFVEAYPRRKAPVGVVPAATAAGVDDFSSLERPAIWRTREQAQARVSALEETVSDRYDIPAFLRKQAD